MEEMTRVVYVDDIPLTIESESISPTLVEEQKPREEEAE
jgi:hypothetical protein